MDVPVLRTERLLPRAQRQGFAPEAVTAAAEFAVSVVGWEAIDHVIDPGNAASIAVARAVGSRLLRPVTLPAPLAAKRVDLWGQTAADWRSPFARLTALCVRETSTGARAGSVRGACCSPRVPYRGRGAPEQGTALRGVSFP